jgi:hypothetical protein
MTREHVALRGIAVVVAVVSDKKLPVWLERQQEQ